MCFFPAGDEMLFGVLTRPYQPRSDLVVTMLTGGGYVTSTHRNRLNVRLARHLAAAGHHAFRFDYHGTGESGGTAESFYLDTPFDEDLRGAIKWLESQGLSRHVLVGTAFGARTALVTAPDISGLESVVLITPALTDVDRTVRWRDRPDGQMQVIQEEAGPEEAVSRGFLEPFTQLIAARVPQLIVYGADQPALRHFVHSELGQMAEAAGQLVDVQALRGPVRQLLSVAVQDALVDLIAGWLRRQTATTSQRPPG